MKHTSKHIGAAALALTFLLSGCSQTNGQASGQDTGENVGTSDTQALSLVTDIPTTQSFTDEAVKEEDVTTILTAGVNTPSAMNGSPGILPSLQIRRRSSRLPMIWAAVSPPVCSLRRRERVQPIFPLRLPRAGARIWNSQRVQSPPKTGMKIWNSRRAQSPQRKDPGIARLPRLTTAVTEAEPHRPRRTSPGPLWLL